MHSKHLSALPLAAVMLLLRATRARAPARGLASAPASAREAGLPRQPRAVLVAALTHAQERLAERDARLAERDARLAERDAHLAAERRAHDSERRAHDSERRAHDSERQLLEYRLAAKTHELDLTAGRLDVRSVLEEIARQVDAKRPTSTVLAALAAGTADAKFTAYLARVAAATGLTLHHLQTEGAGAFQTLSSHVHHPHVAGGHAPLLPAHIFANRHVLIFVTALFRFYERDLSFYDGSPATPLEPLPSP